MLAAGIAAAFATTAPVSAVTVFTTGFFDGPMAMDPDGALPNSANLDSPNAFRVAGNPVGTAPSFVDNISFTHTGFAGVDNLGGAVGLDSLFFANDGVSANITFFENAGMEPSTLPSGDIAFPAAIMASDTFTFSLNLADTVGGTSNNGDELTLTILFNNGASLQLLNTDYEDLDAAGGVLAVTSAAPIAVPGGAVGATGFTVGVNLVNGGAGANQAGFDDLTIDIQQVPEPSTALLGALGLLGILRRRR